MAKIRTFNPLVCETTSLIVKPRGNRLFGMLFPLPLCAVSLFHVGSHWCDIHSSQGLTVWAFAALIGERRAWGCSQVFLRGEEGGQYCSSYLTCALTSYPTTPHPLHQPNPLYLSGSLILWNVGQLLHKPERDREREKQREREKERDIKEGGKWREGGERGGVAVCVNLQCLTLYHADTRLSLTLSLFHQSAPACLAIGPL